MIGYLVMTSTLKVLDPAINMWDVAAPYVRSWIRDELGPEAALADKIRTIASHLAHANTEYRHPFLVRREGVKDVGLIVVTSDKGLCGGGVGVEGHLVA